MLASTVKSAVPLVTSANAPEVDRKAFCAEVISCGCAEVPPAEVPPAEVPPAEVPVPPVARPPVANPEPPPFDVPPVVTLVPLLDRPPVLADPPVSPAEVPPTLLDVAPPVPDVVAPPLFEGPPPVPVPPVSPVVLRLDFPPVPFGRAPPPGVVAVFVVDIPPDPAVALPPDAGLGVPAAPCCELELVPEPQAATLSASAMSQIQTDNRFFIVETPWQSSIMPHSQFPLDPDYDFYGEKKDPCAGATANLGPPRGRYVSS